MERSAGVLLPISSLPSRYGIGCFDESAYRFVDFLKAAGQSCWQILPLGPTSYGDSPYQSFSAFAGNPYFIDLSAFVKDGLLTEAECRSADMGSSPESIDYSRLYKERYKLLKKAYLSSGKRYAADIAEFAADAKWLGDYALFMALKEHFGGIAFTEWDEDIRLRKPDAVERYTNELAEDIGFHVFLQYHFFHQWNKLKDYAGRNGVRIIGDIPIYVAADSADVWAEPELFQLNENRLPTAVAGCPPDGFAAEGQLWGNPLYDWGYHRKTGFRWWIKRLSYCFSLYDVVRIDHFRGFDEYYSIPYGEKTARNGEWKKGVGMELFSTVEAALGKREIIAEDLGFMTESVKKLVKESGFPNMKVLQFAFDSRDTGSGSEHLPHNYGENCVAYTGTHDNQTITSWYRTILLQERVQARDYLCDHHTPDALLHRSFISLIMRSRARLCIIPMQDWLGLTDESRINTPSTLGGNWRWRLRAEQLSEKLCADMLAVTQMYGRASVERKQYEKL